jgi:hypothetical protein
LDHTITIDRLPDGFSFPPEFEGRLRHDPSRRTLTFRGFMSKAEFDRLSRLQDDWGYRRAIEELFRLCTLEPELAPTNRLASVFARLLARRDRAEV